MDDMDGKADLKEAERPHAPKIDGATELHRRQGRHLAQIHRMYLLEMAQVRRLLNHIQAEPGSNPEALEQLVDQVDNLDMLHNFRNFGALCGQECRHLFFHHDAEEHHVFPVLEMRGSAGLRAVVAKLRDEHRVIHQLLERFQDLAHKLQSAPGVELYQALCGVFEQLEHALKSHFHYEETELEESLGYHNAL